jgi:PhoH-like ATPase
MPMRKTYVLDTNVFLADPNALYAFEDNDIVIPTVVLEELDAKKKLMDEIGRNARFVSKQLDELREIGSLHEGVQLRNGGFIKVAFPPSKSPVFKKYLEKTNDNLIIATAHSIAGAILVSRDTLVRVKADAVDVKAENYQHDKVVVNEEDLYRGYSIEYVEPDIIDTFFKQKRVRWDKETFENHGFILKSNVNESVSAIGRYKDGYIHQLYKYNEQPCVSGIEAKNVQQKLALDILLDDDIPLVTLTGKAGTGKTLVALASALQKALEEDKYNKIVVARPIVPLGKDIGYLPGEKEEKLRPWMQPIFDNLEYLFNCKDDKELAYMLQGYEDIIQIEALTYIRGRSIPNQIMIIDEAQNLTQHEVKTILTRVGEGTKIILTGDPYQIDHPYLDMYSNGLTYVIEKTKHLKEAAHITLSKGERSTLAQLCADLL